jgi:hypothetical protein
MPILVLRRKVFHILKQLIFNNNRSFSKLFPAKTSCVQILTRWFKYDRDDLCVNKSQFVPVIFEPPCKSA